ncbi:MAG: hypothetical protein R3E01_33975 [Pirellulaceae bacterium]|nr:hypothetical protein [Planctomycetales bacterium]
MREIAVGGPTGQYRGKRQVKLYRFGGQLPTAGRACDGRWRAQATAEQKGSPVKLAAAMEHSWERCQNGS